VEKYLGEILVELGVLSQKELGEALLRQEREPTKLLGQILLELGYLSKEELVLGLRTQAGT